MSSFIHLSWPVSVACCASFILFCCVPSLRDHVVGVGDFIVYAESTAIICVDDFIDFMSNTHEKKFIVLIFGLSLCSMK